jgi:hypothetical protein
MLRRAVTCSSFVRTILIAFTEVRRSTLLDIFYPDYTVMDEFYPGFDLSMSQWSKRKKSGARCSVLRRLQILMYTIGTMLICNSSNQGHSGLRSVCGVRRRNGNLPLHSDQQDAALFLCMMRHMFVLYRTKCAQTYDVLSYDGQCGIKKGAAYNAARWRSIVLVSMRIVPNLFCPLPLAPQPQ